MTDSYLVDPFDPAADQAITMVTFDFVGRFHTGDRVTVWIDDESYECVVRSADPLVPDSPEALT